MDMLKASQAKCSAAHRAANRHPSQVDGSSSNWRSAAWSGCADTARDCTPRQMAATCQPSLPKFNLQPEILKYQEMPGLSLGRLKR